MIRQVFTQEFNNGKMVKNVHLVLKEEYRN